MNFTDPSGTNWGPIPTSLDEVKEDASDLWQRGQDVAIATTNAPLTIAMTTANTLTAGDCGWGKHLMVVCEGGVVSDHNDRSFTTGNTVNVPSSYQDFWRDHYDDLIEHESNHATQWAMYGPSFPIAYQLAGGADDGCSNVFEQQAGLKEGQYHCGSGSAMAGRRQC